MLLLYIRSSVRHQLISENRNIHPTITLNADQLTRLQIVSRLFVRNVFMLATLILHTSDLLYLTGLFKGYSIDSFALQGAKDVYHS